MHGFVRCYCVMLAGQEGVDLAFVAVTVALILLANGRVCAAA